MSVTRARSSSDPVLCIDHGYEPIPTQQIEPTPNLAPSSPSPKKPRFRLGAAGASMFGRVGAGIAALGVIMGTMVGDGTATTNRSTAEPVRVERSVQPVEASFVSDLVRRASHVLAPFGLEHDEVLQAMTAASVSVDIEGKRFGAWIHRGGVVLSAQPAMEWSVDWAPNAHISQLSYDFDRGAFRAQASGLGPDGIYERIITKKANEHLRARLPLAMQQPGYSLWTDHQLEQNLQQLFELMRSSRSNTAQGAPIVDGMSNPSVSFSFVLPATEIIPLEGGYTARLERGTRIELSADFEGALSQPRLEDVRVRFDRELEIARGDGVQRSGFRKIDIRSATLRPGGQIDLDYELGPEQMVDGARALVLLFAVMAEPRAAANLPPFERTRLESLRRDVQQKIDDQVEPVVIEAIRTHDGAVPGLSLTSIFGIPH